MLIGYFLRAYRHATRTGSAPNQDAPDGESDADLRTPDISQSLDVALSDLKKILGEDSDLVTHRFHFGMDDACEGAIVYFDGLVNSTAITEAVLRPILNWRIPNPAPKREDFPSILTGNVLCSGDVKPVDTPMDLASACLSGDVALLIDGCLTGLDISAKGWDKRSVTEPQSETVVRGPREGFTENMRTNTALIRRKIKTGKLRSELLIVGKRTQTSICIMYLDGVANPKVIETVKHRIKVLDVDSILESGYIEEYIEDAPFSPFATIGYSEKPDVVAARVLEGRVAIVVDGTPFVLTVPMLFIESFQTAEDYYTRAIYASAVRILRYFAYFIAVYAPGIYVALTVFHQELIPTTLLFTVANAREGTPFPVFLEMLIMVFAFEILREGGIRLPRPVGQAISIVGALVMGDAAVSAGIVGAPVVITIAITAVAGFLVPSQSDSVSLLRIVMLVLASSMGFYGLSLGFIGVLIHLSTLDSFGTPYFDGFALTYNRQDSIIRLPLWAMINRPKGIAVGDIRRRRFFIPPGRPFEGEEGKDGENS